MNDEMKDAAVEAVARATCEYRHRGGLAGPDYIFKLGPAVSVVDGIKKITQGWSGPTWKIFEPEARSAIEAYHQFLLDRGYEIVPREPTKEMCVAGDYELMMVDTNTLIGSASKTYRAMILAVQVEALADAANDSPQ